MNKTALKSGDGAEWTSLVRAVLSGASLLGLLVIATKSKKVTFGQALAGIFAAVTVIAYFGTD